MKSFQKSLLKTLLLPGPLLLAACGEYDPRLPVPRDVQSGKCLPGPSPVRLQGREPCGKKSDERCFYKCVVALCPFKGNPVYYENRLLPLACSVREGPTGIVFFLKIKVTL